MAKFLDYDGLVHYTSCFKPGLVDLVDSGAKNLIPITRDDIKAVNPNYTWNGYTATVAGLSFTVNEDLSVTISGTTSTTAYEFVLLPRSKGVSFLPNGDYVLSGGYSGTYGTNLQLGVNRTSGGSGVRYASYVGTPVEFTVSDAPAANGVWIGITNNSPGLQINATVKPMICTKSAWNISQKFVPYRPTYEETVEQVAENENNILKQQDTIADGGNGYALINGKRLYMVDTTPTDGRQGDKWIDENSVKSCQQSDNLINLETVTYGYYINASGEIIQSAAPYDTDKLNLTDYIAVSAAKYTLSASKNSTVNTIVAFCWFDANGDFLSRTTQEVDEKATYSFTAEPVTGAVSMRINYISNDNKPMLNTGDTAKPYEPYGLIWK